MHNHAFLSRAFSWFTVLAATVVFLILLNRARLGIDFTDESYYASVTEKLVRGATPFVDEFHLIQLAEYFPAPLAWLHHHFVGSNDGLILFLRCSYLTTSLLLSLIAFAALRSEWGAPAAFLMAFLGVAYVPFNIMGFSYNNLGMQFFSAGLFLGFHACHCDGNGRLRRLFFAGVLFGATVVAYAPLVLGAAAFGLALVCQTRSLRSVMWLLAGGSVLPLLLLAWLGADGVANVLQGISFSTVSLPASTKPLNIWNTLGQWFLESYPHKKLVLLGLFALPPLLLFARKNCPPLALAAALLVLFPLPFPAHFPCPTASMIYGIYFAFTALVAMPVLWHNALARRLFGLVWVPSLVGGYVTALTSGNGAWNMALGLFPGMVAALALILLLIRQAPQSGVGPSTVVDALTHVTVPLTVVGFCTFFTCQSLYGCDTPGHLTARVDRGPFAGLYTDPKRAVFIRQLTEDLQSLGKPDDRVFFFYQFPAGDLLTDLHWASNFSFQYACYEPKWLGNHKALEHYWKDPNHQPTLVVKFHTIMTQYPLFGAKPFPFSPTDTFLGMLEEYFTLAVEREHFSIYRRRPDSPAPIRLSAPY